MLAPGDSFLYRPVTVAEAFDVAEAREFDLATMLSDERAKRHVDMLASVDAAGRLAHTRAGASLRSYSS